MCTRVGDIDSIAFRKVLCSTTFAIYGSLCRPAVVAQYLAYIVSHTFCYHISNTRAVVGRQLVSVHAHDVM